MARLTRKEKEMLCRAAEFVLAGEWPWTPEGSEVFRTATCEREAAALQSARDKLTECPRGGKENG